MNQTRRTFASVCGAAALRGAAAGAESRPLRAGAATVNITPPLGVLLDGTIMQIGPARHVHDDLHARCLLLDDGSTRFAIVVCDCTMISREVLDAAKRGLRLHAGEVCGGVHQLLMVTPREKPGPP